jgi:hypothetical protein
MSQLLHVSTLYVAYTMMKSHRLTVFYSHLWTGTNDKNLAHFHVLSQGQTRRCSAFVFQLSYVIRCLPSCQCHIFSHLSAFQWRFLLLKMASSSSPKVLFSVLKLKKAVMCFTKKTHVLCTCVSPNSYVDAIPHSVDKFRNETFKEVIKVTRMGP